MVFELVELSPGELPESQTRLGFALTNPTFRKRLAGGYDKWH